jgi:RimJ/RimL family protein N-acetyltransferase
MINRNLKINKVELVPLSLEHLEPLTQLAKEKSIWEFHAEDFHEAVVFKKRWFDKAIVGMQEGKRFVYAIYVDNQLAGSSGYHHIDIKNRTIDIGYTWYHPAFWGTGINYHAKYLLLKQAFEEYPEAFNRVGFCINSINQRSCKAVEKIGATYEGTLRNHMIRNDGSIRHSCMFSILLEEWPRTKVHLENKIGKPSI